MAALARQSKFVLWYYLLVCIEAAILVFLTKYYWDLDESRWYAKVVKFTLLRNVSPWYLMLTSVSYPREAGGYVVLDILTSEDHLYSGRVGDYLTDSDGKLTGILLDEGAKRFDRKSYLRDKESNPMTNRVGVYLTDSDGQLTGILLSEGGQQFDPKTYLRDKDSNPMTKPKEYWKPIPGLNLYVPADKILNLNIRHESDVSLQNLTQIFLRKYGIEGRVQAVPDTSGQQG